MMKMSVVSMMMKTDLMTMRWIQEWIQRRRPREGYIDEIHFDDFEDELYIDTGHVNRLGNLIISEQITKEILATL